MALVRTILDPELPLLFKEEALQLLRNRAKTDFSYDTDSEENARAAQKMKDWAREAQPPAARAPGDER